MTEDKWTCRALLAYVVLSSLAIAVVIVGMACEALGVR